MNSRELAFIALKSAGEEKGFATDILRSMHSSFAKDIDFNLAQEIIYGVIRMEKALDYIAKNSSSEGRIPKKRIEKILLRMGIYQICFMEKIPLYAVVNEMVELAKKYCGIPSSKYLNAVLRKINPALPKGKSSEDISISLSYPKFFVEKLSEEYGKEKAIEIMKVGNHRGVTMVRVRGNEKMPEDTFLITQEPFPMYRVSNPNQYSKSESYYIQNATPATLLGKLAKQRMKPVHRILDLCASPGGKSIAAHDCFPKAILVANDVSQEKLIPMKENFDKYGIEVELTCMAGEKWNGLSDFDIVIVDSPCTNSGVFNKRPEARWRLDKQSLKDLTVLQNRLLENAARLLAKDGEIWYMTCSILKEENEDIGTWAESNLGMKAVWSECVLPSMEGWDGGFGMILKSE